MFELLVPWRLQTWICQEQTYWIENKNNNIELQCWVPLSNLWFEFETSLTGSHFWILSPQPVELFGKVVESLGVKPPWRKWGPAPLPAYPLLPECGIMWPSASCSRLCLQPVFSTTIINFESQSPQLLTSAHACWWPSHVLDTQREAEVFIL